ncbi:hypothetical protein BDF19DRAFT_134936 [Syncephalis fuscata]|nr:hypothetical protein BDF19DRAFT_134936 [Syncephalis fuscata]
MVLLGTYGPPLLIHVVPPRLLSNHHHQKSKRNYREDHQATPSEQEAFHMLFKVSLLKETTLRRATPRVIADAVVHRVGEGDGYAWQPGASYVNADNTIAQTFHYRCSLRTDPAKRRTTCHGMGYTSTGMTKQHGQQQQQQQQPPLPAWRFLDCYNCGGLVKVAIATDHSYAVVTIDHRMLHRRPTQRGIVSSSSPPSSSVVSSPMSMVSATSVFPSILTESKDRVDSSAVTVKQEPHRIIFTSFGPHHT